MFSRFAVPSAIVALAFLGWVLIRLVRLTRRGDRAEAGRLALRVGALWLVGLLFVPAGLLLPWILRAGLWRRLLVAFVGAGLLSSMIELIQAYTPLGTAFDITDIILNTSGAVAAVLVACAIWKLSVGSITKKHEIRSDPAGRVGG